MKGLLRALWGGAGRADHGGRATAAGAAHALGLGLWVEAITAPYDLSPASCRRYTVQSSIGYVADARLVLTHVDLGLSGTGRVPRSKGSGSHATRHMPR